jgi:phthalate 4,5-dioxygenase oxygenase subunit
MQLPPENLYVTKSIQDCSWLQGLEGECDSSHLSILHKAFSETQRGGGDPEMYAADSAPRLDGIETDFGLRMVSCRNAGANTTYLRVSNFVLPCHGFIPTGGLKGNAEGYTIHSHVPIDDEHSMRYNIHFRRGGPFPPGQRQHDSEIGPDFRKRRNLRNDYLQDREQQKRETFTGMGKIFLVHDSCATESMGPIFDRSQEHLGVGDSTVIAMRKFLLRCARVVENGEEPPHVIRNEAENDLRHVACIVANIDSSGNPKQYIERLLAQL